MTTSLRRWVRPVNSRALLTALLTALVTAPWTAACGRSPAPPRSAPAAPSAGAPSSPPAPGGGATSPSAAGPAATPLHVMVVVLENRDASGVIDSPDAPFLSSLARTYGMATESFGAAHPSLPNYLALVSGSTHGITSDCTDCSVDGANLADQLSAAGIPWRAYMEGLPSPCFLGPQSEAGYAKKHDPFVYFRHFAATPAECDRVVPYDRLSGDLASPDPPAFVWVTPNLCHSGHDCDTATTDRWLAGMVRPVMASSWFSGGVIVITYDEGSTHASCCGGADGGRIATVVVTARVPPGARWSQPVDPAGILATIEDLYGLPHLGLAASPASGNILALTGPPPG